MLFSVWVPRSLWVWVWVVIGFLFLLGPPSLVEFVVLFSTYPRASVNQKIKVIVDVFLASRAHNNRVFIIAWNLRIWITIIPRILIISIIYLLGRLHRKLQLVMSFLKILYLGFVSFSAISEARTPFPLVTVMMIDVWLIRKLKQSASSIKNLLLLKLFSQYSVPISSLTLAAWHFTYLNRFFAHIERLTPNFQRYFLSAWQSSNYTTTIFPIQV